MEIGKKNNILTSYETSIQKTKKIAPKLGIDDRVDTTANKDAFITLKDHKPNFGNKPTYRLVNPNKSEIGRISKVTLDRINSKITRASKFNQWKNSSSVIEWFKAIENKQHQSFICLDIVEFYPPSAKSFSTKHLTFPQFTTTSQTTNETSSYMLRTLS